MDREPAAVVEFEEVAGPICAEHESPARLIVSLLKRETCDRVTNGVNNVRVGDPVFPCGGMDTHTQWARELRPGGGARTISAD